MRREFELIEEDNEYLESCGLSWEAVIEGGVRWVIQRGILIPVGYSHAQADVAVQLPGGYRDVQIDMAYFFPGLSRADGKPIGALSPHSLSGRIWQRWSRHRTSEHPWRAGIDNLCTHMQFVRSWLERELGK